MAMDMLEHENVQSESSIAARGSSSIITFGDDGSGAELSTSFLCKRMEIDFAAIANLVTDDASARETTPYMLILHKTSVDNAVDTVAEQLDARLEDRAAHQSIIWRRYFIVAEGLQDDGDNIVVQGIQVTFKTSKSFRKGFRFDKDETYSWTLFNPNGAAAADAISISLLNVRYWGVNIQ